MTHCLRLIILCVVPLSFFLIQTANALKCHECLGRQAKDGDPLVCTKASWEQIKGVLDSDIGIAPGVKIKVDVTNKPDLCMNISQSLPQMDSSQKGGDKMAVSLRAGIKKEGADLTDLEIPNDKLNGCYSHQVGQGSIKLCFCDTEKCNGNGGGRVETILSHLCMVLGGIWFWWHF